MSVLDAQHEYQRQLAEEKLGQSQQQEREESVDNQENVPPHSKVEPAEAVNENLPNGSHIDANGTNGTTAPPTLNDLSAQELQQQHVNTNDLELPPQHQLNHKSSVLSEDSVLSEGEIRQLTDAAVLVPPSDQDGYDHVKQRDVAVPKIQENSATGGLPQKKPIGTPPLDVQCGPLLRYLGMHDKAANLWRGTAMIVTQDETSDYSQVPFINISIAGGKQTTIEAEKLWAEQGVTFWRFQLEISMQAQETAIEYAVNGDKDHIYVFYVPAIEQTMNTMFYSCNGFSYGVAPSEFKSELWKDVMRHHEKTHYHVMLGGGDQIYCDAVKEESPAVHQWAHEHNPVKKHALKFDDQARQDISQFFLWHYIKWFGSGYWKGPNGETVQQNLPLAMAQIPMINIFDDHDIIDGFGSYTDHTQRVPIFNGVGNVAYKYYLLFQHQTSPQEEPTDPSWVIGDRTGPYITQKSRSVYARLGKEVAFYGLDCRTERKRDEVVTRASYTKMFTRLKNEFEASDGQVKHLLLMLGVPIAYPRLVWLEKLLTSRVMDPVKYLARRGMFGGLLNQFDGSIEIVDDLDDHWCAKHHKKERNKLVKDLAAFAAQTGVRITVLSGDVHLAGIGRFYSKAAVAPERDGNLIFNIISSAIVNTPPPDKLADFLNKRNKIHHLGNIDEDMVRIFHCDVDGTKRNNTRLLPRRNWCSIVKQGDASTGNARPAGPAWDTGLPAAANNGHEPQYADDPDTLSIVLHMESDQHSEASESKPYELLVPALASRF